MRFISVVGKHCILFFPEAPHKAKSDVVGNPLRWMNMPLRVRKGVSVSTDPITCFASMIGIDARRKN